MIREDQYNDILKQAMAREMNKPRLAIFKLQLDYGPDKPHAFAFFACSDIEKLPNMFQMNRHWFKNPVGFSVVDIKYLTNLPMDKYQQELAFADIREDV